MQSKLRHYFIYSLILLLAISTFSGAGFANGSGQNASLSSVHLDVNETSSEPVTVIVELEAESIAEANYRGKSQSKEGLAAERENVISSIEAAVSSATINQEYDYVFSGFSVEVAQNELHELAAVAGVKAVYPNETYEVSSVDEAELIDAESFSPAMMDSAPFIGSDLAWDAGYTGEGVTVAVIDTGVDYTHPELADNFGDYKGWDFVDNNDSPQETPAGDPRGDSTNHGTHVAGTVAANGDIKGVAPDATLLAYRVLGPGGSGTTENVIAGIERAVEDGADVMNLSLGNTTNDPDFATSIALDWAMAEGVVAVTSNGNSGPNNWTVGSPGTSREAISVGATQLPYNLFSAQIATEGGAELESAAVMGHPGEDKLKEFNGDFEFVHVGYGEASDFEGVDAEGKIALISRGEIPFVDKATNAKNAGAAGAIIYNNVEGVQPDVPGLAVPTLKTSLTDGQKLLAELEAGSNTVNINVEFDREVGETMANFSSRGPVMNNWMIKPDVSAPGVAIVSTVPTHNPENPYGYASLQGTSMSAPHVAGAAALVLQANPDWSVDFVKAALMNTAEKLYDADGVIYPHNSQGAGSIRVLDAINAETLITPGSHSFGVFTKEKGKEVRSQSITINNLSDERKRYSFNFEGTEGIKVMNSNNTQVQPGRTQDINFRVQVDASKTEPGYHEGVITISKGDETLQVPTIVFVQDPDYPLLNTLSLALEGGNLVGTVNAPGGAEHFNLRIRDADTGELLAEPAAASDIAPGIHSFSWDMTIDDQPLTEGNYQINAYAKSGEFETELAGPTLTIE
ncbi:S8 family serine peptidase [Evansella clarkii]|uniref:S8 family serine peptidase n=1 Tax=Evansella clarkii TaxID=79879 RepID=UPI000B44D7C5|nr:S8 family serine peptidase [Evansella clarkii]